MEESFIHIQGARVNNLKNVTLDIPRNKLIVITGLSGSGKSSLAFDTLYAEGQRRYVESLNAYARQFLGPTISPAFRLPLPSNKRSSRATRAPRWARAQKFMSTCACFMPASVAPTVPSAVKRCGSIRRRTSCNVCFPTRPVPVFPCFVLFA